MKHLRTYFYNYMKIYLINEKGPKNMNNAKKFFYQLIAKNPAILLTSLFVSIILFTSEILFAQAASKSTPSSWEMIFPIAVMFLIMYLFMIRPQQKRMKEQQGYISSLKPGDEVVTSGGLIGRIRSIQETFYSIEVASDTVIKVVKSDPLRPMLRPVAKAQGEAAEKSTAPQKA
jgi:preprotein translocase subunit YajC